ncbi:hypothetical protein [Flavobacterium sp. 245]|uniref:hypothetical protein n=1 Tax=Flavobacterium sp. 245 TaxID=2512115 RepID=UPI00106170D6|nr:hypothetical protein [Flavobacterium sp. 245]TDP02430.1 hypothetical protein EV145_103420 [Flavobacterium sp. 245]
MKELYLKDKLRPDLKKSFLLKKQDKVASKFILVIISSLLLFEVFSGALRYYFSQWGMSYIIYLPKIACFIAVVLKIIRLKIKNFIPIIALVFSILVALFNSAVFSNIAFSFFVYSPVIFGILYGKYIEIKQKEVLFIVWICLIASIFGIFLDSTTDLPWKGFVYNIGDIEVQANRQWQTFGEDRIAGFSRISASLAIMIAIFSLYINAYLRSNLLRFLLFGITFYSIILTTNKSTVVSYLISLVAYFLFQKRSALKGIFYSITAVGVFLPVLGIFLEYSINTRGLSTLTKTLLFSFDDRLTNTWPNFYENVLSHNGLFWGTGLGTIGTPYSTFPIKDLPAIKGYSLGVADNTFLYLWGIFGVIGVWLYTRFYWLMKKLAISHYNFSVALCCISVCVCVISWTTDIFEAVVSSLFIGIAISRAIGKHKIASL